MTVDRDYVLGTHDEELVRLGLQHRVWRPHALRAWMAAGFTIGDTIVDVGCGPGHAALDLAEITGAGGRVVAVDRSRRFLTALETAAAARGVRHIQTVECDLDRDPLPNVEADGVWIRWVFAFVRQPKDLLSRAVRLLKRGGSIVVYEYFDYSTWRFAPRSEVFERFVNTVMETWRAEGGEPDIALNLPAWFADEGMDIISMKAIVDVVRRRDFIWQWPSTFVTVGLARLVELGRMSRDAAEETANEFARRADDDRTVMMTPGVLEITARKR